METTRKQFEPVIGVTVSKHDSAFGVVRKVVEALMDVSRREVTCLHTGERIHMIYVVQALPFFARTGTDPWSPLYPTRDEAIVACTIHAPVEVNVR